MKKQVSQKQLSQILNVSPQAVAGLTTRSRLVRDEDGLYNLSDPENRSYLKEKGIKISEIKIPETPAAGRPVVNRPAGKIKTPINGIDKSGAELNRELTQKKIEKLNFEMEIKKKKYLPTDFIEGFLIRYIEALHSNIERSAGATIRDYAKEILNAGELTPDMINRWINVFLNLCHSTKIQMLEEIKNYDPNTGGKK
jgi:hypothetical protein